MFCVFFLCLPFLAPPPPVVKTGGVVLLCNEYGCRSSFIRPPIVPTHPPVIYMPASPGPGPLPSYGVPPDVAVPGPPYRAPRPPPKPRPLPPHKPADKESCYDQNGHPVEPAPPDCRTSPEGRSVAPREQRPQDAQAMQVQREIMQFCREHPRENFCRRLEDWLAAHPEAAPQ